MATKLNSPRVLLGLSFFLTTPSVFYWLAGTTTSFSDTTIGLKGLYNNTPSRLLVTAYLLLFFAFFVKRAAIWKDFFIVGAFFTQILSFIVVIDEYWETSKILPMLRGIFIQPRGMWPMNALATVGLIPFAILMGPAALRIINLTSKRIMHSIKEWKNPVVLFWSLVVAGLGIYLAYSNVRDTINCTNMARHSHVKELYAMHWVIGIAIALLQLILYSVAASFVFATSKLWISEVKNLGELLRDFRINRYVTRRIVGYLYTVNYLAVVIASAVLAPAFSFVVFGIWRSSYDKGVHLLPYLSFPGVLLAFAVGCYLTILLLRLVVEAMVALIHIAESASRSGSRI